MRRLVCLFPNAIIPRWGNLRIITSSFVKTGQDDVINSNNLPGIIDGMRKICALQSTLLGNVSGANGYFTTTAPVPAPTASSSRGLFVERYALTIGYTLLFMGVGVSMGLPGL